MPWLAGSVCFLTRHGSHAYGTALPTSDLDFKGWCIPSTKEHLFQLRRFEQAESKEPYDSVIYEIRKFVDLAADCNPSIIEILYTDPSDHIHCTLEGEVLLTNRDLFLSRKAKHTFSGYAHSQFQRIKRHYRWLTNPPKEEPTRAKYGLPEYTAIPADQRGAAMAHIKKKMDEWNGLLDFDALDPATAIGLRNQVERYLTEIRIGQDDVWKAAARTVGLDDNWLEILKQERAYNAAREEWRQYQGWKAKRNPDRAVLEAKFGYDTKHAMHLVRLMRMAREILEKGQVLVKRPDAEDLLAIRRGIWRYEQLEEWMDSEDKKLTEAYTTSPLPKAPDRAKIDAVITNLLEWKLRSL